MNKSQVLNAECAVTIAVRERPMLSDTDDKNDRIINNDLETHKNLLVVEDRPFVFDTIMGPNVAQEELYHKLIDPLVGKLLQGFYCTVLAYGQTGTGKSFTMGLHSLEFEGEKAGVVPRALKNIFNLSNTLEILNNKKITIHVSFIEIYNEKVYDLLGENITEQINTKGYKFIGGRKCLVNSLDDAQKILNHGNKNRHVRPTKLNTNSSRSHAVFTIHVSSICKIGDTPNTISAMHLVDLAGSEGVRRTGHQGAALTEGVSINQGLLSIGKVLQALSIGLKVIPYRDSVLSSVLQDSLNINSYLTLLACISPMKNDLSETLSTLRFAQNAKSLKHTPQINAILADFKKSRTPLKSKTPMKLNKSISGPLRSLNMDSTFTPAIAKPRFTASTAIKRPTTFKNNTFCTPNKLKHLPTKLDTTVLSLTTPLQKRKSNRKSMFPSVERLLSRESVASFMNVSTSTIVEDNHQSASKLQPTIPMSYSPIVRLCRQEFEQTMNSHMDKVMAAIQDLNSTKMNYISNENQQRLAILPKQSNVMDYTVEENMTITDTTVIPQYQQKRKTNTPKEKKANFNNLSWNTLKQEMTQIVRNEISNIRPALPVKSLEITAVSSSIKNYQQNNNLISFESSPSSFVFNITDKTDVVNETFTTDISPINSLIINRDLTVELMPPPKLPTVTTKIQPRRSARISIRRDSVQLLDQSQLQNTSSAVNRTTRVRKSVQISKPTKALSPVLPQPPPPPSLPPPSKKSRKSAIINEPLSKISSATSKAKAKKIQKEFVLKLFNNGNIKELQMLPQIGIKSAYQIITYRSINGKFKNLDALSKIPIWRGKGWERFQMANYLL